MEPVVSVF